MYLKNKNKLMNVYFFLRQTGVDLRFSVEVKI